MNKVSSLTRTIVVVVTDYFPPATRGGAVRALSAMTGYLKAEIDFRIITRDHDALTGELLSVSESDQWVTEDGFKILRLSSARLSLRNIQQAIVESSPTTIFANSLFSRLTQILLLLRKSGWIGHVPLIIAPEGELSPGALAVKKSRKLIWLMLAKATGLVRGIVWKVASEFEQKAVGTIFSGSPIALIPHLVQTPPTFERTRIKTPDVLRLLFLSRISPKKNLQFLLEVLGSAPAGTELSIVGPV